MRELRRIWVGRGEFIKREGEKTDEWWRGEERGASYGNERENDSFSTIFRVFFLLIIFF